MRILHLSDVHVWRWAVHPARLAGRRLLGMMELGFGRAWRFRRRHLVELVDYAASLRADHVLITGDLTTTALPSEFKAAKAALSGLVADPGRLTVVPGNHDRYTARSWRERRFEAQFSEYMPQTRFPWLRELDADTAILGLDPTRPAILTARGRLPEGQLEAAKSLLASRPRPRRLIVACHYPLDAPSPYRRALARKRLVADRPLREWLNELGAHLYCCGHIHTAWAFTPAGLPAQLCLNPGAPLLRRRSRRHAPGFFELHLLDDHVLVVQHQWVDRAWRAVTFSYHPDFFSGLKSVPIAGRENHDDGSRL